MVPKDGKSNPIEEEPKWLGLGKFLLLALFFVLTYLLAQDMVQHHFFRGGALNDQLSGEHP